jgi:hypothetical protein
MAQQSHAVAGEAGSDAGGEQDATRGCSAAAQTCANSCHAAKRKNDAGLRAQRPPRRCAPPRLCPLPPLPSPPVSFIRLLQLAPFPGVVAEGRAAKSLGSSPHLPPAPSAVTTERLSAACRACADTFPSALCRCGVHSFAPVSAPSVGREDLAAARAATGLFILRGRATPCT